MGLLIFILCLIFTIGLYPELFIVLAEESFFFVAPTEDFLELTKQEEVLIAELKLLEGYAEVLRLKFESMDVYTYRLYFNDYINDLRQLKIYVENIQALNESLAIVQEKLKLMHLDANEDTLLFCLSYVGIIIFIALFLTFPNSRS